MSRDHKYPLIRTATLDAIWESNAKALAKLEGSNPTEDEKDSIKELTNWVTTQEEDARNLQEEILDYLESRGCPVWDYLKK